MSGRDCAVPLLFGPALPTLLPFQGAGIDAPGIQQIYIQVYLGEKVLPSVLGVLKAAVGLLVSRLVQRGCAGVGGSSHPADPPWSLCHL